MKIISPFKDYYDHIAYIYGIDETVTYVRNRIVERRDGYDSGKYINTKLYYDVYRSKVGKESMRRKYYNYHKKFLVVAGKMYLLLRVDYNTPWLLAQPINPEVSQSVIELSKLVGQPVFTFQFGHTRATLKIDGDIPILGDLGIPSIIPPERMYQDIEYFLANTMHKVPDTQPPVEISNKDKIIGHGFDIKKSFRHRR